MGTVRVEHDDRFYLDANAVIAIVERSDPFTPAQKAFLQGIDNESVRACTGEISLTECMVKPIRDRNEGLIRTMLDFFGKERTFPLVPVSRSTFLKAAEIRALDYLQLPDAIHVACAMEAGCTVFVSADKRLRMPATMRRIAFDDIEMVEWEGY